MGAREVQIRVVERECRCSRATRYCLDGRGVLVRGGGGEQCLRVVWV